MEARGLTFQRDRWHTRLAHLRDFELRPEAAEATGRAQKVTQVKRGVVEGTTRGSEEVTVGIGRRDDRTARFGIADEGAGRGRGDARVICVTLIISYSELDRPERNQSRSIFLSQTRIVNKTNNAMHKY